MRNKVAIITGGGSGIGRASAILFAKEGAKVVIANRREDKGEETINLIKEIGGEGMFIKTDISVKSDVKKLIKNTISKYGKLDCAFNCGGVDGKAVSLLDSEKEWNYIIDINLKGTFYLLKYEIECMLKTGKGSIVNMSSICGKVGRMNRAAYTSSRHGVEGLTKTAALEFAKKGIRINAIAPGSIKTDIYYRSIKNDPKKKDFYKRITPLGRSGEPEEVAEAALWLCSDKSSFITGHILMVDGGISAGPST